MADLSNLLATLPIERAKRVLRSAARGITPIGAVMASPPTMTEGAANANSTIQTAATVNQGGGVSANAENPLKVTPIGGKLSGINRVETISSVFATPATRTWGHGAGIRFATRSQTVDFCWLSNGLKLIVYVTEVATGVRARVAADDLTPTDNQPRYRKLDFGSPGMRIIEVIGAPGSNAVRGINVPNGERVWAVPAPAAEARLCLFSDSYDQGALSDSGTTNPIKLATPDYLGERLGVTSPYCCAVGGTGVLNDAAGGPTRGTFQFRVDNGDIDASRAGVFDLIRLRPSVNDAVAVNAGYTDAAAAAAFGTLVASVMTKQPDAIIVGTGPQWTPSIASTQSRYDTAKAAFLAAAGSDPRMIWIDNSPSGEDWYGSGVLNGIFGPDNLHPTAVGAPYLGYREADSMLAAIRTRFGL